MKDLQAAVKDLQTIRPWRGLAKTAINVTGLCGLIGLALTAETPLPFFGWAFAAALLYASAFITTHDALHHTLTGNRVADEVIGRLISWPGLWFHGTYQEMHRLHHKMNGNDWRDPERPHWNESEYRAASPLRRWYVRHQWPIDIFVLGGFGMIVANAMHGMRWYRELPSVRRALWTDVAGLVATNALIYGIAAANGLALRWFLTYLVLERVSGGIHQMRSHLEHYGLWGRRDPVIATQLYASRNISTGALTSLYFNGLNFHSVHHAFPRVPFYLLEEAHRRLARLADESGEPLPSSRSYIATSLRLAATPLVLREDVEGTRAVSLTRVTYKS